MDAAAAADADAVTGQLGQLHIGPKCSLDDAGNSPSFAVLAIDTLKEDNNPD